MPGKPGDVVEGGADVDVGVADDVVVVAEAIVVVVAPVLEVTAIDVDVVVDPALSSGLHAASSTTKTRASLFIAGQTKPDTRPAADRVSDDAGSIDQATG